MSTRYFVCEPSLTPCRKKELVLLAALDQALRPRLGRRGQPHRGEDVHEHAAREEVRDALRAAAGHPLDVVHEVAEAVPYGLADLGIVARRVRSHLAAQVRAIADEQLAVGGSDRLQGLFAALALGGPLEDLERLPEASGVDRDEEVLLRAEEPEDVRL